LEHAHGAQEPADKAREEHPLAEAVRAEVRDLPERECVAVLATYFDASSAADVAALLGTSVRAVEGLLRRARGRLWARLQRTRSS
jgi:RNA polymerase sigma-70 factor (ECF subfamily)